MKLIVLIPAYNEELCIAKTIQSILVAGMQVTEVYVINDASTDHTSAIAAELGVNVIDNEFNLGKARGVENALKGIFFDGANDDVTHVCFMDADTLVDVNYFTAVERSLSENLASGDTPISVLCGRVKSIPHNWLTAFRAYELWQSYTIHKIAQSRLRTITVAPGCTSTYSVNALKNVTWSEDTATEDMDSTVQVALAGGVIKYENKAIVYTQDPSTIKDYLGQIGRRWYPGTWQVFGKHKLITSGPFSLFHWECRMTVLEPIMYALALIYMTAFHPASLASIFGISALIVLFFAIIASINERRFDILLYSPIYPVILTVNLFMFVGKIGNIFGRAKNTLKWYSPTRYSIESK